MFEQEGREDAEMVQLQRSARLSLGTRIAGAQSAPKSEAESREKGRYA